MHPRLHPLLRHISSHSTIPFLHDEGMAIDFATEIGLILSRWSIPPNHCDHPMRVEIDISLKLGWTWRCAKQAGQKRKGHKMCRALLNPVSGTVFENSNLPFVDFFSILINFWRHDGVNSCQDDLKSLHASKGNDAIVSTRTIVRYYRFFRSIAITVLNSTNLQIGGPGKTVELDETFLTRHKYHRGRRTKSMSLTVFGMHCREDKETLFFPVDSQSKRDLWPYLSMYVDPETTVVCTDGGKQYNAFMNCFVTALNI